MAKITIGIPGYVSDTHFGAGKTHLHYMQQFGDIEIIMPHEECRKVDLLYLPGGMDMNPANYGGVPSFYAGNQDVHKEFFLRERLKNYVESKTPIFGVCLGFQSLNVFFGGGLEQHLMFHPQSPQRREAGHKVRLITSGKEIEVNSHHHQGILESQVADCFSVLAVESVSKKDEHTDKVVEAILHKTLPIAGVQWHPEEWYDGFSSSLIKNILKTF